VVADCSGAFPSSYLPLLKVLAPASLASPAIAPSELELFYVQYEGDLGPGSFLRTTRPSKGSGFPPGQAVAELDAACQPDQRRAIDLSLDGLRAYLMCFPFDDLMSSGELRIARRASLADPFVLDPMSYGQVGASPTIAPDELTVYTSFEQGVALGPLQSYTRTSVDQAFGPATTVDVATGSEEFLASPDIAPDNNTLFAGFDGSVVQVIRNSATTFGTLEVIRGKAVEGDTFDSLDFGAPDVSADCRTVYAIEVDTPADGAASYSIIQVAR
jgi:hypothetical protein